MRRIAVAAGVTSDPRSDLGTNDAAFIPFRPGRAIEIQFDAAGGERRAPPSMRVPRHPPVSQDPDGGDIGADPG
jgi:hypothetical protein